MPPVGGYAARVSGPGGRAHGKQTLFPGAAAERAPEGIKIKRLQHQHSFPGQMTVSLDFDDLEVPPVTVEAVEATPPQSTFSSGLLVHGVGAQPPAQQAWQASTEPSDPWTSAFATRRAGAAKGPTHGVHDPDSRPEPEVVPWAVKRTKITSSPAKDSVQIRIPNDRTTYEGPASDENAFGGRRGNDGGVPRSKLAMAEVRQRRLQEKQKKLAEQGKQSKLRELEQGIRRRAAAAAAATAATAAEVTAKTAASSASGRSKPQSPARSKRRGQPKLSPSRAAANQKAAAKRLSQPRPPTADGTDAINTSAENSSVSGHSAPPQKGAPSARRDTRSTVDWDSLLVESDVAILSAVANTGSKTQSNGTGKEKIKIKGKGNGKGCGKGKSRGNLTNKVNETSDNVQSAEPKRAAKGRVSKPSSDRRHTIDATATPGGKQRLDKASTRNEGAVGQLKNTWQQLQHEPSGKRSTASSSSTAPSFASRVGKSARIPTSSRAASATSRTARSATKVTGSATQKRKQKRRKGAGEVNAARKNGSRNSLDSLLTDETSGSHSSSPLDLRRTEQADENESMLQEMKVLLADLIQQHCARALADSEMLEQREAAAHNRADADLERVLALGDDGSEDQEAHTMIKLKLANELAEIGKLTAHQRVESARQNLNLQHWEERMLKLCDEADAFKSGVSDVPPDVLQIRELMAAMAQQGNREEDPLQTTQQRVQSSTSSVHVAEAGRVHTRQVGSAVSPADLDARQEGRSATDAEDATENRTEDDSNDGVDDEAVGEGAAEEDVKALAIFFGIDPLSEPHLMWIAHQCLDAELPAAWSEYFEEGTGNAYYYNDLTKITTWDHPLDSHFKALVQDERLAHAAREVLSTTDYSTDAGMVREDTNTSSQQSENAVVQSDELGDNHSDQAGSTVAVVRVDANSSQQSEETVMRRDALGDERDGEVDVNGHEEATKQSDTSSKPAPPKARMVQSTDGKPLDLSDLNVSVSTTPAKDSPERAKTRKMLSPKSLAAQIITLSSDSDTENEHQADCSNTSQLGQLIPSSTSTGIVYSPAYSDQSSLDIDALETSLLEHHRSTSPSPQQVPPPQQMPTLNDEIMSDISAHSEDSDGEDTAYPHSPQEPKPNLTHKLDDALDTSLSQTELDVIVQELHHIEDEEDVTMCEQDRDAKAMAALRRIAKRTEAPSPIASPGPSYVEPVLSPSRSGMSNDASESCLIALRTEIEEALACTDLKTVQLMLQEVVTRAHQLQKQEQQALQPDVDRLIAAAHRMERRDTASKDSESNSDDDHYTDDDFEEEDDADARAANGFTNASVAVAQKSPSSPVTPTIDPLQTSSPTKTELMAGIGEADNAFAYSAAIQNDLADDLAIGIHDLSAEAALASGSASHGEGMNGDECANYHSDLAQDIAQSLSDSGVWSDEPSLSGPVDSSDQHIIEYIGSLFEFARRQLGKPESEASPTLRQTMPSESQIALSFVLEKTHEPNHQLFVALERERERLAAEDGAIPTIPEAKQIYNMAIFDACAEEVATDLAAASVTHHRRQHWLSSAHQEASQNAVPFSLTQEMLTQRVLSSTKWQLRNEDVQPQDFRSNAGFGPHRVLGAGVHDGPGHHGHGRQKCVVDSIVRAQFVAESRSWFDRAEEEEELQHYLADQILETLIGETIEVLDTLQNAHRTTATGATTVA